MVPHSVVQKGTLDNGYFGARVEQRPLKAFGHVRQVPRRRRKLSLQKGCPHAEPGLSDPGRADLGDPPFGFLQLTSGDQRANEGMPPAQSEAHAKQPPLLPHRPSRDRNQVGPALCKAGQ